MMRALRSVACLSLLIPNAAFAEDPTSSDEEPAKTPPTSPPTSEGNKDAANDAAENKDAAKDGDEKMGDKKDEEKEKDKDKKEKTWKRSCTSDDETTNASRASIGCSVVGLRISFTGADVPNSGLTAGVMVASMGEDFGRWGWLSARGTNQSGIGGGGSGLEGELGGSLTVGLRVPFGSRQGPVARVGIAGNVLGNDRFYSSRIELPRAEFGYQYMSGVVVVEAGATIGHVIDGRYGQRVPTPPGVSPHTPISGFEVGGYLAVQVPHVRLGVALERAPLGDGLKGDVLVGRASACLAARVFALCGDLRAFGQDGLFGNALRSTVYGGITIGFTSKH